MTPEVFVIGTPAGSKKNQYIHMVQGRETAEEILAENRTYVMKQVEARNLRPAGAGRQRRRRT